MMIAAIDGFDRIREGEGKACADLAVRRVADVLRGNFRSADHICRLNENEFVIILTRMNSAMQALIFDKVEQINAILNDPENRPVPLSLSVGVAFSDREKPEGNIFQDADTALYRMKQVRHCGCAVF